MKELTIITKKSDNPADSFSTIENTIDGLSVKVKAFIWILITISVLGALLDGYPIINGWGASIYSLCAGGNNGTLNEISQNEQIPNFEHLEIKIFFKKHYQGNNHLNGWISFKKHLKIIIRVINFVVINIYQEYKGFYLNKRSK